MASEILPSKPPADIEALRAELKAKRAIAKNLDHAIADLQDKRDDLRRELFELEETILQRLVKTISLHIAEGTRLPNYIRMIETENGERTTRKEFPA